MLENCIESVLRSVYDDFEIIVIDNGSNDGSVNAIKRRFGDVHKIRYILLPTNIGVTRAYNIGIRESRAKYVVTLGNDTVVDPAWLSELLKTMERENYVGAAQCKLIRLRDGRLDSAGCQLCVLGFALELGEKQQDRGQYDREVEIFSAGLPASIFLRSILLKVGLLDPVFFAGYEDADLCWRIRLAGYRVLLVPRAKVYHIRSATSSRPELQSLIRYHFCKNRFAMLWKNLSLINAFKFLPLSVLFSLFYYVFNNAYDVVIFARALRWFFMNMRHLTICRAFIQTHVRKVNDRTIAHCMAKSRFIVGYYIKRILEGREQRFDTRR